MPSVARISLSCFSAAILIVPRALPTGTPSSVSGISSPLAMTNEPSARSKRRPLMWATALPVIRPRVPSARMSLSSIVPSGLLSMEMVTSWSSCPIWGTWTTPERTFILASMLARSPAARRFQPMRTSPSR